MAIEHDIQNQIRAALADDCILFRINVGKGMTYDGRHFDTGAPKGYSDLSGHRIGDGRAVYIEVKAPGGRVRPEQKNFIEQMRSTGAIAGICHSAEEALDLIHGL